MTVFDNGHGFDDVIAAASPPVQALARRLRGLIDEVYPGAVEVNWGRQKIAGYGVGPRKQSEHFGYIAPQGDRVNLGFNHGASLPDPAGKLEGEGKALRHVKVRSLAEADDPALAALLKAAVAEREGAAGR